MGGGNITKREHNVGRRRGQSGGDHNTRRFSFNAHQPSSPRVTLSIFTVASLCVIAHHSLLLCVFLYSQWRGFRKTVKREQNLSRFDPEAQPPQTLLVRFQQGGFILHGTLYTAVATCSSCCNVFSSAAISSPLGNNETEKKRTRARGSVARFALTWHPHPDFQPLQPLDALSLCKNALPAIFKELPCAATLTSEQRQLPVLAMWVSRLCKTQTLFYNL